MPTLRIPTDLDLNYLVDNLQTPGAIPRPFSRCTPMPRAALRSTGGFPQLAHRYRVARTAHG
jgi:hypothetical protein